MLGGREINLCSRRCRPSQRMDAAIETKWGEFVLKSARGRSRWMKRTGKFGARVSRRGWRNQNEGFKNSSWTEFAALGGWCITDSHETGGCRQMCNCQHEGESTNRQNLRPSPGRNCSLRWLAFGEENKICKTSALKFLHKPLDALCLLQVQVMCETQRKTWER